MVQLTDSLKVARFFLLCRDGTEAMLTVRGATAAEFKANLQAVRGLLEPLTPQPQLPAQPPASPAPRQGWCAKHGLQMVQTTKEGRSWWSHKTAEGWCKGR
jgi:hypothetical protein